MYTCRSLTNVAKITGGYARIAGGHTVVYGQVHGVVRRNKGRRGLERDGCCVFRGKHGDAGGYSCRRVRKRSPVSPAAAVRKGEKET